MKTCAIGAMLFGGTLGAVSTADAGVTAISATAFCHTYSSSSYDSPSTTQSFLTSPVAFAGAWGSIGVSAWSPSGFSSAVSTDGGESGYIFQMSLSTDFTVSGAMTLNMTRTFGFGSYEDKMELRKVLSNGSTVLLWGAGATNTTYTTTLSTLGAGESYRINWDSSWVGLPDSSFAATFAAVPAPGAAALVGLAGLVGGRRRRA